MKYRFYTCDVFTQHRFGGNQLAVLPEATGLTPEQMQQVAREFNFSESAFVFPARAGNTRHVRIFTPFREVPFAGHPNIGTAFVLASTGEFGAPGDVKTVTFEEQAGLVAIDLRHESPGQWWFELAAPEPFSIGQQVPAGLMAAAVGLRTEDIVTRAHPPQVASVGLPFVFAEVSGSGALERARPDMQGLEQLVELGIMPDVFLYTHSHDEFDLRARMFAPHDGVPEDPATGSANCALAGLLCSMQDGATGSGAWRVAQGVEMGRPSILDIRASKTEGQVTGTWVGGTCVMVSDGEIELGNH